MAVIWGRVMDLLSYFGEFMASATLYRHSSGSYDSEGRWSAGGQTGTPVVALIPQPVTGENLRLLPEGEEVGDYVSTAVASSLEVHTRQDDRDPDVLDIGGVRYECHTVLRWGDYGGFDKLILRRVQ